MSVVFIISFTVAMYIEFTSAAAAAAATADAAASASRASSRVAGLCWGELNRVHKCQKKIEIIHQKKKKLTLSWPPIRLDLALIALAQQLDKYVLKG